MSSRSPSSKKGKGVSPPLVSGGSSETVAGAAGPAQQCSIAIPITSSFSKPSNKQQGFRFSLRRMLYNSPLVSQRSRTLSLSGSNNVAPHSSSGASRSKKKQSPANLRYESESPSASDASTGSQSEVRGAGASSSSHRSLKCAAGSLSSADRESEIWECPVCLAECPRHFYPELLSCQHRSCLDCLQQYLRIEISESRVHITCPECSEPMHPNDIRTILNNETLLEKYEDFMLRRVLAADPDSRWCPAPDCGFVVLATGCASCPRLLCQRPGCGSSFCYHCKALWHPNQTCDAARAQRSSLYGSSVNFKNSQRDDIKPCPRCQVLIAKMDDGSCNHMTCALCGAEFCWLCMKEISDLHYLSPSGCTFWGKKPWSRKKKILWQLGTLVGAPVGIALLAGIAVPAMIIGIPIWVGRKLFARFKTVSKHKRNAIITSGVAASVIVAPAVAGVAVGVGVPILLAYVYGVVPVSLCRSGVCGVSASPRGVRIDFDDEDDERDASAIDDDRNDDNGAAVYFANSKNTDAMSVDTANHLVGNPSIGEASVALSASGSASLGSASQLYRPESDREDCESASQLGLAGSIASTARRLEVQAEVSASPKRLSFASETASATISLSERSTTLSMADDGAASTRALAGSLLSYKMGDTGSVHSYRMAGAQTSVSASGSVKSGYAPIEVHVDGEESSTHGYSAGRSSSPTVSNVSLSGDEIGPGVSIRRSARRLARLATASPPTRDAKWVNSDTTSLNSVDHVRFDDHVSYIDGLTCNEVHFPPDSDADFDRTVDDFAT